MLEEKLTAILTEKLETIVKKTIEEKMEEMSQKLLTIMT